MRYGCLINFIYKDELYKDGQYIDYKKCYNSIVKHIFEPNRELYDIDVFQHCWNIDLENDLVSLYKPIGTAGIPYAIYFNIS